MAKQKVYEAIAEVISDLSKVGVGKDQTNTYDRYKFRGIDDVYNALAPLLAKHKLCVLPKVLDREVVERMSQKGGALFYVTVKVEYCFVSAEDGSSHTVVSVGEAMDRGDKATNKAMSAAYKYACFQAFCIPTEGDNDADGATHEVAPQPEQAARPHPNSKEAREAKQAAKEQHPVAGKIAIHIAKNEPEFALEAWQELDQQEMQEVWQLFNQSEKDYIRAHKQENAA